MDERKKQLYFYGARLALNIPIILVSIVNVLVYNL